MSSFRLMDSSRCLLHGTALCACGTSTLAPPPASFTAIPRMFCRSPSLLITVRSSLARAIRYTLHFYFFQDTMVLICVYFTDYQAVEYSWRLQVHHRNWLCRGRPHRMGQLRSILPGRCSASDRFLRLVRKNCQAHTCFIPSLRNEHGACPGTSSSRCGTSPRASFATTWRATPGETYRRF